MKKGNQRTNPQKDFLPSYFSLKPIPAPEKQPHARPFLAKSIPTQPHQKKKKEKKYRRGKTKNTSAPQLASRRVFFILGPEMISFFFTR